MRVCIYEKTGGCYRSELFSWQIGRPRPTQCVRSSPPSLTLPSCCIPCPSYTGISASSLTRLLLYTLLTPKLLYNVLIPASKQHRPHSSHNSTLRAKLQSACQQSPPIPRSWTLRMRNSTHRTSLSLPAGNEHYWLITVPLKMGSLHPLPAPNRCTYILILPAS